jgi:hypothetical protein
VHTVLDSSFLNEHDLVSSLQTPLNQVLPCVNRASLDTAIDCPSFEPFRIALKAFPRGEGPRNAARRRHGLKAQAKKDWLAGKEIRVAFARAPVGQRHGWRRANHANEPVWGTDGSPPNKERH